MLIAVAVRASGAPPRPSLTLELRSGAGDPVPGCHAARAGAAAAAPSCGSRSPDLPLLGGDYDFALGAAERDEVPELERTVRFSVPQRARTGGDRRPAGQLADAEPGGWSCRDAPEDALERARARPAASRAAGVVSER